MAEKDREAIAELASQLGYPVGVDFISEQLRKLSETERHRFLVCENSFGKVVGWIHLAMTESLISEPAVHVVALVVDERSRGLGIGKKLLQQAEIWAGELQLRQVVVRSNITRSDAHRFYETQGYKTTKTSHFFEKFLSK